MRGVRTRIWGYSNFTGHGFVGRHRFEGEDTDLRQYMDLSLTYGSGCSRVV
jgi:hypothetical protein